MLPQLEWEYEQELEGEWEGQPGAEYLVVGRDQRVQVPRSQIRSAPYRFICNLEYDFAGVGPRAMCSGTLIGPRTVLTAGHCISGQTPGRMRIVPGRYGTWEPLPATAATAFRVMPGHDIGIIHLRDPIGNTVGFWGRAYRRTRVDAYGTSMSAGALPLRAGVLTVNVAGYPGDMPRTAALNCRNPGGRPCDHTAIGNPGRHRTCGTFQYRAYNRTVRERSGHLYYLNDTCPGHSGSPVWVRRHPSMGGRVLVGVHVGGGRRANRAVRITPAVLNFIRANTI